VGIALAGVGILLSANRFVRLISNSSAGWLCDRWPRRHLFVPSLFLGALSTAIYSLTQGFWPLLLGRLLWGISWSGIWVGGNAIVFDIVDDRSRGRWVGIYHVSFFTGAASGSILGGSLTDWLGYPAAMAVAAALTLVGALAALLFLPETRDLLRPDVSEEELHEPTGPDMDTKRLKIPELVSATALLGINRVVIAGILASTFGVFLKGIFGESVRVGGIELGVATLTGLGLGLSTLSSMLFTPLVGSVSDRAGNRWRVAAAGLTAGTAGFGLMAWGWPLTVMLGLPLTFFASSSNQGLATAMMGDMSAGDKHGRLLGILFTVGDLGSAIGPPLAYLLIPVWGTHGVYWLSAGLFGLMIPVALRRGKLTVAFGGGLKREQVKD
jgi:MFS family permease